LLPLPAVPRTQEKQQLLKAQWLMQQHQEVMQQRQDEMSRKFQQQQEELVRVKQQYAQLQEMQGRQALDSGGGQQIQSPSATTAPGPPSNKSTTQ
jgi:hypothetical protein